jgi:PIN domain nuclease of toxin-antitoxin system
MKYLLDSHALLWTIESPEMLSAVARKIINDGASRLCVSIATPWELAIKANTGKLNVHALLREFEFALSAAGYELVDTRVDYVVRAGFLPLHHRDPFDRLMIGQALELSMPIISRDRIFDRYGVKRIWD